MIGDERFQQAFWQAQRSVFRLESLQHYPGDSNFDRFVAGQTWQDTESKAHWTDLVRRRTAAGVSMERVRLVTEPWTPYTTFELTWSYPHNVEAGEDIRVVVTASGDRPPRNLPERTDFWLFDDTELWWLRYDPDGSLITVEREVSEDRDRTVASAHGWRREAMAISTPLSVYIKPGVVSA